MIGIAARGNVAAMAHTHAIRNFTNPKSVRDPVSSISLTVTGYQPIAMFVGRPKPKEASAVRLRDGSKL